MAQPAIRIEGLRADLEIEALTGGRLSLAVERGALQLSEPGLQHLLPPGVPLRVRGIEPGRVLFRYPFQGHDAAIEARPTVSPQGRLRVQVVSIRWGIFPAPVSMVMSMIRSMQEPKPGLEWVGDDSLEIKLSDILGPLGIHVPLLTSVRATDGLLELRFGPFD